MKAAETYGKPKSKQYETFSNQTSLPDALGKLALAGMYGVTNSTKASSPKKQKKSTIDIAIPIDRILSGPNAGGGGYDSLDILTDSNVAHLRSSKTTKIGADKSGLILPTGRGSIADVYRQAVTSPIRSRGNKGLKDVENEEALGSLSARGIGMNNPPVRRRGSESGLVGKLNITKINLNI